MQAVLKILIRVDKDVVLCYIIYRPLVCMEVRDGKKQIPGGNRKADFGCCHPSVC